MCRLTVRYVNHHIFALILYQAKSDELQERLDNLSKENRILRKNLQRISEACAEVTSENHSIKVQPASFYFKHNTVYVIG